MIHLELNEIKKKKKKRERKEKIQIKRSRERFRKGIRIQPKKKKQIIQDNVHFFFNDQTIQIFAKRNYKLST